MGGDVNKAICLNKTLFVVLVRTKIGYFDIKLSV